MKQWPSLVAALACSVLIQFSAHAQAPAAAQQMAAPVQQAPAERIELGRYLALAGNCVACHTAPGGQSYSGGTPIPTPFGVLYGPNITSSPTQGIGKWTEENFWNALHNGKSPGGESLYPAFPYTEYKRVTRVDSNALYAYLMSLPASDTPSRAHELNFPYDQRALLGLWRALYFTPGDEQAAAPSIPSATAAGDAGWVRGRYLVEGLGHCAACHTARNRWGASETSEALQGGPISGLGWYATPLTNDPATGMGKWTQDDIVALLRTGVSRHGVATGPMAEVVLGSTQHLTEPDLRAIATYVKSLPATAPASDSDAPSLATMQRGGKLYEQQCSQCHQASGEGSFPAWPALAGNISVTAAMPDNAIRMVLEGGFAPATESNPRPHGMPPFGQMLNVDDVAAVVTYIRNSWGNRAGEVRPFDVTRLR